MMAGVKDSVKWNQFSFQQEKTNRLTLHLEFISTTSVSSTGENTSRINTNILFVRFPIKYFKNWVDFLLICLKLILSMTVANSRKMCSLTSVQTNASISKSRKLKVLLCQ